MYQISENFNPRSPHGERRSGVDQVGIVSIISIHAPRMGSDISRHYDILGFLVNFNPRSPHGERRTIKYWFSLARKFQSTLPAWGAT